ncbi:Protein of unknown function [Bacillus wiedmannii]|uniref:Uncharacterized protein n=1 Tax=Bacillus wiedmannii TaxID=1890302 RepID=A0A1C4AD61_9BACI|nr:Protein of unknown function [Bacillus wiedmannii]
MGCLQPILLSIPLFEGSKRPIGAG